jgi:hypothetical protein
MALNSDKEVRASLHIEEGDSDRMDEKSVVADLKLDEHGLPLVPQPSDHKDDPLVSRLSISSLLCHLLTNGCLELAALV